MSESSSPHSPPLNPNASRSPPLSNLTPPSSPLPQLPSRPILVKLAPLSPPSPTLPFRRRAPSGEEYQQGVGSSSFVQARRYSDSCRRMTGRRADSSHSDETLGGAVESTASALGSLYITRQAAAFFHRQTLRETLACKPYPPDAQEEYADMNLITDEFPSGSSGGRRWMSPQGRSAQWKESPSSFLHDINHPDSNISPADSGFGAAAHMYDLRGQILPVISFPGETCAPQTAPASSAGNSVGGGGGGTTATTSYYSGNSSSSNMMTADDGSACVLTSPAVAGAAAVQAGTMEGVEGSTDPKDSNRVFVMNYHDWTHNANRRKGRSKTCSAVNQHLFQETGGISGATGDPLRRVRFSDAAEWCEHEAPRQPFGGPGLSFSGTTASGSDGGGLLDFASGQLTVSFDATSGGIAPAGSILVPSSDAFSKGEFAFLPDAHTNMSCYLHSSHPSVSYWCASKAAAAVAAAAAAAASHDDGSGENANEDFEVSQRVSSRPPHRAGSMPPASLFRRPSHSASRRHSGISHAAAFAAAAASTGRRGSETFSPRRFWGFTKKEAANEEQKAGSGSQSEVRRKEPFQLYARNFLPEGGAFPPIPASQLYGPVDWRSLVGAPSSACKTLKTQQQQQLILHQRLLQHQRPPLARGGESFGRRNSWCACRPMGSCSCCLRTSAEQGGQAETEGRCARRRLQSFSSGGDPPLFDTRLLRGEDEEDEDERENCAAAGVLEEEAPSPETAEDSAEEEGEGRKGRLLILSRVKSTSPTPRAALSPKSGDVAPLRSLPPRPHSSTSCGLGTGGPRLAGPAVLCAASRRAEAGGGEVASLRPLSETAATAEAAASSAGSADRAAARFSAGGGSGGSACAAGQRRASLWTPSSLLKSFARSGGVSTASSSSSGSTTASAKTSSAVSQSGESARSGTLVDLPRSGTSPSGTGKLSRTFSAGGAYGSQGSKDGASGAVLTGAGHAGLLAPGRKGSAHKSGVASFTASYGGFSSLARVLRPRRHSHHHDSKGSALPLAGTPPPELARRPSPHEEEPSAEGGKTDDQVARETDDAREGPLPPASSFEPTGSQKLLETAAFHPASLASGKTRDATESHWGNNSEEDKSPPLSSYARSSHTALPFSRAGFGSGHDETQIPSGGLHGTQRSALPQGGKEEEWSLQEDDSRQGKDERDGCEGARNRVTLQASAARRSERRYHTAPSAAERQEYQATLTEANESSLAAGGEAPHTSGAAGAAAAAAAAGSLLFPSSCSKEGILGEARNGRGFPTLLGYPSLGDPSALGHDGSGATSSCGGKHADLSRQQQGVSPHPAQGVLGEAGATHDAKGAIHFSPFEKSSGSKATPVRRGQSSSGQNVPSGGSFFLEESAAAVRGSRGETAQSHPAKLSSQLGAGPQDVAAQKALGRPSTALGGIFTARPQRSVEESRGQRSSKIESAGMELESEEYDLQFGGLLVRLHRKLSAKCHCQFDVWEGEAVGVVPQEEEAAAAVVAAQVKGSSSGGPSASSQSLKGGEAGAKKPNGTANLADEEEAGIVDNGLSLASLHTSIVGIGKRFAIKLLEVDGCDASKLKYKTHSVLQEGKQLRSLCLQLWRTRAAAAAQGPNSSRLTAQQRLLLLQLQQQPQPLHHPEVYVQQLDRTLANHRSACMQNGGSSRGAGNSGSLPSTGVQLPLLPIPRYLWTSRGIRKDGTRVLGVSMERIEGRSLTQILQQMRVPTKKSAALLAVEIAIKLVRAQAVLASPSALDQPIINWDTKPGNVLVELTRSVSTQQLHCLRCVIIDLGDSLPGPNFSFPTRHQPGVSPSYIICTKGYCSPECAILVFLLAAGSKSSTFRKVWYGQKITSEEMLMAKKQRLDRRWQSWIRHGYLKKVCPNATPPGMNSSSEKTGANEEDANKGARGKKECGTAEGSGKANEGGAAGTSGNGTSKTASSYWEVLLSARSVVFSTGLVIGQLFGGPNLLQVVSRDEVAALDALCEWGCTDSPNVLLGRKNLHPDVLLPTQGVFAAEPWKGYLKTMLRQTLAFLPSDRWSFEQLESFLIRIHAELAAAHHVVGVGSLSSASASTGAANEASPGDSSGGSSLGGAQRPTSKQSGEGTRDMHPSEANAGK
ncbi:hypothetical protein BESB_036000 [Besnoitia besnoiti]|uniref:Protein kinase domain-containing protein n=1 Tax=Besnoitia besnoiti TaxID=94643 RepID=A0A2A9MNC4_BESBE|nr:hypothetical protein BESB_036000 [Besnoitia besnoiti]PFH37142.1 hypothetical protein BESB_036000 [Besnoitia besnoiti]